MEKAYDYWLQQVPGIGDQTIFRLLQFYETSQEIWLRAKARDGQVGEFLKPSQRAALYHSAASFDIRQEYEKLQAAGIRLLVFTDREYPERLRQIPDPPFGLYLKGRLPEEAKLSVAVIGARECSEYGRYVAAMLGKALGENDIPVISGMARGIDGISQAAALEAGGFSVGVLGSGVDVCYPPENRRLYEHLGREGGLLSAFPPGTEPKATHFPPRNRIVSGLADVLVVVEARQKSGTLITVDMALEQGREVFVVPGRITDRLSDGCHRLLRLGAGVVTSPKEFIREIRELFPGKSQAPEKCPAPDTSPATKNGWSGSSVQQSCSISGAETEEEGKLLRCLDLTPKSVEQLCLEAGTEMTQPEVKQLLTRRMLAGEVMQPAPGFYAVAYESNC